MARSCTRAMFASVFFERGKVLQKVMGTEVEDDNRSRLLFRTEVIIRSSASASFSTVVMNRTLNGVLKVFNKFGTVLFSKFDEQILRSFADLMKIWGIVEYMSGYLKKQESLNNNILGLVHEQLNNPGDTSKKLTTLTPTPLENINSWTYSLDLATNDKTLASDLFIMFNNIKGDLKISEESLKDFLVMIGQCHYRERDNNLRTTTLCVQCLYKLFMDCRNIASNIDVFAMMLAFLCRRIKLVDFDTLNSAIFGRYNQHAAKLIRFEIMKFLASEIKLLAELDPEDAKNLLGMTKEYMIDSTLETFKENTMKLTRLTRTRTIRASNLSKISGLRELVLAVIPGLANTLGHFRSQEFISNFPSFKLFEDLENKKGTCIDTFLLVNSL